MSSSRSRVYAIGTAATVTAVLLSLTMGVFQLSIGEVTAALLHPGTGGDGADSMHRTLILQMRLPRAVAALLVGSSLGAAGCMLQALLRDPLASPTIIGTAQAAGFGRVFGVFVGLTYAGSVALSFAMAVVGAVLVLTVARSRRGFPTQAVLLTGVNVGMLFAALIGLTQYLSRDEGQLSRMILMLLGGLWQVTWVPIAIIAPFTVAALVLGILMARHLDLLSLGEADADRLGLRIRTSGTIVLLLSCLLTSLAVSIAGIVAFVGLVVPHAARKLVGPAHHVLLPASMFLGGVMTLCVDVLARSAVPPNELPLGVLTSLIGVPCFLVVMNSMLGRRSTR